MHNIKGEINISVLKYNKNYIKKIFLNINLILIQKNIGFMFDVASLNKLWSGCYNIKFEGEYIQLLDLFTKDKDIIDMYHKNDLGYMKINIVFNQIKTNEKNINTMKYYGNDNININILAMVSFDICRVDIMGEKKYVFTNVYNSRMESNARYNYCRPSERYAIASNLFPEYENIIKDKYEIGISHKENNNGKIN